MSEEEQSEEEEDERENGEHIPAGEGGFRKPRHDMTHFSLSVYELLFSKFWLL